MKIAIIGAIGNAGARIVTDALRRGHSVTGVVRNPSAYQVREGLLLVEGDANQPQALAPLLAGHDVIVSAIPLKGSALALLIDAVRRSHVKRYLVVGGAVRFPEFVRKESTRGKTSLDVLHALDDLDWTLLSPSALSISGDRTGSCRLGHDTLRTAADGKSWISYEDYAIALVDEIESPQHMRRRFTVGY